MRLRCELCPETFARPWQLRAHAETHRNPAHITRAVRHSCVVCGRTFDKICDLSRHVRCHKSTAGVNNSCNGQSPSQAAPEKLCISAALKGRTRTHTERPRFSCRHCLQEFVKKACFKKHEQACAKAPVNLWANRNETKPFCTCFSLK